MPVEIRQPLPVRVFQGGGQRPALPQRGRLLCEHGLRNGPGGRECRVSPGLPVRGGGRVLTDRLRRPERLPRPEHNRPRQRRSVRCVQELGSSQEQGLRRVRRRPGQAPLCPHQCYTRGFGCDEFAAAQDRLLVTSAANGGYYLDSRGNLETGTMPAHAVSSRSSPSRTLWSARSGFTLTSGVVTVGAPAGYAPRVDAGGSLAVSGGAPLTVPTPNWPATRKADGTVSWPFLAGFNYTGHLSLPMAIGGTQPGVWCPAGFHPRGEDGVPRVGRGSGRTLTSLDNEAKIVLADRFWCRSDVRYQIGYRKQTHAETCGADPRPACPSGVTLPSDRFSAYGRANCYHTFISLDTAASNTCLYRHPVPQCADADSGTKREWTQQELATYDTGEKFPAKTDGTTPCGEAAEPDPPDLADFTADPCVSVSLSIAENRIAGSAAEPGVPARVRFLCRQRYRLVPGWRRRSRSDAAAGSGFSANVFHRGDKSFSAKYHNL